MASLGATVLSLAVVVIVIAAIFSTLPQVFSTMSCGSAPTWEEIIIQNGPGLAIQFDGDRQHLTAPNTTMHDQTDNSFTIAFRVKPLSMPEDPITFAAKLDEALVDIMTESRGYLFYGFPFSGGFIPVWFLSSDLEEGVEVFDIETVISINEWSHIAGVIDRTAEEARLYVDGTPVATIAISDSGTAGTDVGDLSNDAPFIVAGEIEISWAEWAAADMAFDDLLVYDVAKNDAQILAISGGTLDTTGLVSKYDFNDETSQDSHGSNNLNMVNSPTFTSAVSGDSFPGGEVTILGQPPDPAAVYWFESCQNVKTQTAIVPVLITLAVVIAAILIVARMFQE